MNKTIQANPRFWTLGGLAGLILLSWTFFVLFTFSNSSTSGPVQLSLPAQTASLPATQITATSKTEADQLWNNLPLYFEPNVGQFGPEVEFRVRSNSAYTLFATKTGLEFISSATYPQSSFRTALPQPTPAEWPTDSSAPAPHWTMHTVAANPQIKPEGLNSTGGKLNYFSGVDSASHHYDIPLYSALAYRNIYPGIDQIVYGTQGGELQYDFVVAPQAEPAQIQLHFGGIEKISQNAAGELVLELPGGTFYQRSLLVYQELPNKMGGTFRQRIPAQFKIQPDGLVGFELGAYDKTLPLVIDPVLAYSTYFGGAGEESIYAATTDSAGNIYIAIQTNSTNLTTTTGAYQNSINPQTSGAFIAKLNPNASGAAQLVYGTYLGGNTSEPVPTAIKVDTAGKIYLTGTAYDSMPVTANAYQSANRGDRDAFIGVLNPNVSGAAQLTYATYYGGSDTEDNLDLALDTNNNLYIAGQTKSTNLTTTVSAFQSVKRGEWNGFVARLNITASAANQLTYATYYGGNGFDRINTLALDTAGNIYLAGSTTSTDLTTTVGAYQSANTSDNSGLLVKLNPAASGSAQLSYASYFGASGHTQINSIVLDSAGIIYLGGSNVYGTITTTTGAFQTIHTVGEDGIIAKLNLAASGANQLVYATYLGGNSDESIQAITIDSSGNVYVSGNTASADFPVTSNAAQTTYKGGDQEGRDAFVAWLSPDVSGPDGQLRYASYFGGAGDDWPRAIMLLASDKIGIVGYTTSTDLPTTASAYQNSNQGLNDGFIGVFTLPVPTTVTITSSSNPAIYPSSLTFTATVNPVTEESTIVFKKDGTPLGTAPLVNGVATYTISNLSIGSYLISAVYSETATYGRGGAGLTQRVESGPPIIISATTGISQTAQINTAFTRSFVVTTATATNYPAYGYVVTFTAPVSGPSGLFANGSNVYTGTTDANGRVTASVFTANSMLGTYNITATVAGVTTPTLFYLYNGPVGTRVYGQFGSFTQNAPNRNGISANTLNFPAGVALSSNGSALYIADAGNNRVLRFDDPTDTTADAVYGQNGSFITNTANLGGISRSSLNDPETLALDSEQNLYVLDIGNNRVLMFANDGDMLADRVYGQAGDFTTGTANKNGISAQSLSNPQWLALDSSDNLYVSDANNHRVLYFPKGTTTATRVYGQNGDFTVGSANNGQASPNATTLKYSSGLVLDSQDNLYIADIGNSRVLFYPAGSTTATKVYGQLGSFTSGTSNNGGVSANSLNNPSGLALDTTGGLYVSDYANHRILYFNNDGDTSADRVYGQHGRFTTNYPNNGGLSAGVLRYPYALLPTKQGGLYIAEITNNRVLYYDNPNPLVVTAITDNGIANTPGSLSYSLAYATSGMTVSFALTQSNTITFTGSLTTSVKAGVNINGGNGVILDGNRVATTGLQLLGNNHLLYLTVRRFIAQEIISSGGGSKFYRVLVES